ncbi:MAG: translational GTPase TypA, partial [Bradyrhizobium sp.]|nr:translational GTPase TypA [Bradyrhizobium sp.]
AVAYALWNLEERGFLIIPDGVKVYQGMIIGQHSRDNDLEVNPLKGKQLTNIRTTSKDEAVRLTPPIRMTLEKALAYIEDDELVEVTPKSIRLRKKFLDANDRKRAEKAKEAVA